MNDDFTLVLSGGGALGIAHLGVLYELELKSLIPKELVGTSMGGIVAACISIGLKEAEIYTHIKSFSFVSKWLSFSFGGNSIVDNSKIEEIFDSIFQDKKMCDTKIPLKLIATNLTDGSKKVFDKTDDIYIKDALLATMAIPGIFTEHTIEDTTYVDGFLCENLGVNEASYPFIVAVDVLGKNSYESKLTDNFFKIPNVLDMFEKSMRLLIYNQTKINLDHLNKEVYLIEPNTKEYKTFHFHKIDKIRALGLGLLK